MTINEASEVLKEMRNINLNYLSPDRNAALSLGREALINLRNMRATGIIVLDYQLPGETKD